MTIVKVTRRQLLVGAGGASVVAGGAGLWLGVQKVNSLRYRRAVERGEALAPSVYLAVNLDGEVVIWLTKSEMGQGVSTALPMLIADELDADWSRVRVEQATTGAEFDYGNQFTAASSSISGQWTEMRRAGATAREMLLAAAARSWEVSADQCATKEGKVYLKGSEKSLGYGELAERAKLEWAPIRPKLKANSEFNLVGQPLPRLDSKDKSTGQAVYGIDVSIEGMRYAVIARSPQVGGKARAVVEQAALAVPGVIGVYQIRAGVAVVAENTWAALEGRKRLEVQWQPATSSRSSHGQIATALANALDQPTSPAYAIGEVADTLANPSLVAEYELPYLAHMCMEPMNCTAHVSSGRCELWVPTQSPAGARMTAANVAGLPVENVKVNITQLGGGFGRRAAQDFVGEAVELATMVEFPVQVIWSREDDLRHGQYREASAHRLTAVVDSITGLPTHWSHRIATATGPSSKPSTSSSPVPFTVLMGASDMPYQFANARIDWSGIPGPVPTTIWRSVGFSYNTFVIESFVDELANAANTDPLAYRRRLLTSNTELLHCLNEVADMSAWPAGQSGYGVSAHTFGSTHVALVIQTVKSGEAFRVANAWCAINCGIAVNPDIVRAQVEGGIVDGLSAALFGELVVEEGAVAQSNFHDYPLARMSDVPAIEVRVVSSERYPGGVGEASLPSVAPALANALFSLTGQRVRKLPIGNALLPS